MYIYIYIYIYMYTLCTCIYIYAYIYAYIYIYIYIHIYIYTFICIYIYIYICTKIKSTAQRCVYTFKLGGVGGRVRSLKNRCNVRGARIDAWKARVHAMLVR